MQLTKACYLIASSNPEKLSKFYSLVMDERISNGITKKDCSIKNEHPCQINFYKPSISIQSYRKKSPAIAICFQKEPSFEPITVITDWVEEIISYGGKLIEGPILESFGAEAWMVDEETNQFLIFVPLASV